MIDNRPKGGRGKTNPYHSVVIRVPGPLELKVWTLIDKFHASGVVPPDESLCDELQSLILEIVEKHRVKEKGYCTNSFGTGIKKIKAIAKRIK